MAAACAPAKASCESADGGVAMLPSLPGSGMTDTHQLCDWGYGLRVRDQGCCLISVCTPARSVRKAADAEALAAELGDFFSPLVFDVTDPQAIAAAAAEVRSRTKGRPLLGLVNNAGAQHPTCTLHLEVASAFPDNRLGKRGLNRTSVIRI